METIPVGEKIRLARVKYGMSQTELARRSGLSKAALNALERGRTNDMMVSHFVAIADALYLSVDALLGREVPRRV